MPRSSGATPALDGREYYDHLDYDINMKISLYSRKGYSF